jgi:hypothetical protein
MGSVATRNGGIRGFLERANKSFQLGFAFSREWFWWLAQKGGSVGLFLASTSMVVLLPLIFEINREAMVSLERVGHAKCGNFARSWMQ